MTTGPTASYTEDVAERAATLLTASRLSGRRFESLPDELRPRTVEDGYVVQRRARALLAQRGFGRLIGWKIGCTTLVMQEYLGVDTPISGTMFSHNVWRGHHTFTVSPPRVLGVECEIAVRLGDDLPGRDRPYSSDDVAGVVAAVMASIEVVEDRYVDYRTLDTPTLVADDFFHYGCVLGVENEVFDSRALGEVDASMSINGAEVGRGVGSDILGHPLFALAWLANKCVDLATPLRAGDVASLGSMVQTQWVRAGDLVVVHNEMLGDVSASFRGP
ncbi:MAG TPA: fumarylacetoacetate hydrolase family protein [Acidimicrobiales bacterium]